jgi:membrane protease YdiL (CAAX protease family)
VNASPTSEAHASAEGLAPEPPHGVELWATLAITVLWIFMISRFGEGDVYAVMGPFACAVVALCLALRRRELLGSFKASARGVLGGFAVGVAMTALTYPAFQLAVKVLPSLDAQVQELYHGARTTTLPKALAWVSAVILAEEVLFRGVLPRALSHVTGSRNAYVLAVVAYTLAQLGSGSFIVALLALVCGTIWTLLRVRTQSLLPALIAHAIWTPITLLLYPVT